MSVDATAKHYQVDEYTGEKYKAPAKYTEEARRLFNIYADTPGSSLRSFIVVIAPILEKLEGLGRLSETAPAMPTKLSETMVPLLEAISEPCKGCGQRPVDFISGGAVPSAIAPQWVSVLDRLPEGFDDVLVAHPVYAKTSRDMFGIEIRSASTVRKWVGDAEDTSMHGAYWQVLPKGPQ